MRSTQTPKPLMQRCSLTSH